MESNTCQDADGLTIPIGPNLLPLRFVASANPVPCRFEDLQYLKDQQERSITPCRPMFTLRLTSGLDPYQRDLPTKMLVPRVGISPRSLGISARARYACHHTSIECRDIFTQSPSRPDFLPFCLVTPETFNFKSWVIF